MMAKPKGPMSSYACFAQVIREEHRKKHPDELINFTEFSKKCGDKWKEMNGAERRRFEQMADLDKERYKQEMSLYTPSGDNTGKRGRKTKRKPKDPAKPKRAWSAFFFYCDEFRPQVRDLNPTWKVGDVAKELGKRWEKCGDKTKYEEEAKKDKERYEMEMEAYRRGEFVPSAKKVKTTNKVSVAAVGDHDEANGAEEDDDLEDDEDADEGDE